VAKAQTNIAYQIHKKHDDRHARDFRKRTGQEESLNITELAAFIGSFYDKQNEEFPKGQTAIVTMCGKKYGDKAAILAQEMIGRLDQRKLAGNQTGTSKFSIEQ